MMTGEKYTRPPEIEVGLAAMPDPTASSYLGWMQSVSIEVIVIARRQAADRMLRDQIDSILVERSMPRIRAAVRRHSGAPSEDLDEAEDEAMVLFWEEIQRESFFEVRFNLAMKSLAKRAGGTFVGANSGNANVLPCESVQRSPRSRMAAIPSPTSPTMPTRTPKWKVGT